MFAVVKMKNSEEVVEILNKFSHESASYILIVILSFKHDENDVNIEFYTRMDFVLNFHTFFFDLIFCRQQNQIYRELNRIYRELNQNYIEYNQFTENLLNLTEIAENQTKITKN